MSSRFSDINVGVERFRATPGAVLLDVRSEDEYGQGHIPGSVNFPLADIDAVEGEVEDYATPLFVCCLSGNRSCQAVAALEEMGYADVTDIGGIDRYRGERER